MELIVINQGIIRYKQFEQDFIFRCFLNFPMYMCHLYPAEKTIELAEMEMAVLNNGDREAPIMLKGMTHPMRIYWQDDMPEVPVGEFNLIRMLQEEKWELKEIEDGFVDNHLRLTALYNEAVDRHNKLKNK